MDARLIRRPVSDLLSGRSLCILSLSTTARRHESSSRRTKQRLNVRPDTSFLTSNSSPNQDHIIFNPPFSAPSVLHTPLKFLPKDDKRRSLFVSPEFTPSSLTRLPPPVKKVQSGYQRHHLSEEDVEEVRRLRTSDPEKWTRLKLAKKFNCSSLFVGMCCEAPKEKVEMERAKVETVRAKWGPKRRMAREDRVKRRELAYRDE